MYAYTYNHRPRVHLSPFFKLARAQLNGNRFACCTRNNRDINFISVSVVLCRPYYAIYRFEKYLKKRVLGDTFFVEYKKPSKSGRIPGSPLENKFGLRASEHIANPEPV